MPEIRISPILIRRLKTLAEMAIGATGAPGPVGQDGHSPVIGFGTGDDADRLLIDGVAQGPHLTGPAGGGETGVIDGGAPDSVRDRTFDGGEV